MSEQWLMFPLPVGVIPAFAATWIARPDPVPATTGTSPATKGVVANDAAIAADLSAGSASV